MNPQNQYLLEILKEAKQDREHLINGIKQINERLEIAHGISESKKHLKPIIKSLKTNIALMEKRKAEIEETIKILEP